MATTRTKRQSPARSAPRAAARPRAKAASRADGDATGEVTAEASANGVAASPSPEENTNGSVPATNGPAEPEKKPEEPDDAQKAGYPRGTPLYVYEGPQARITFPHIATVKVDPVFFYDIYELPEMYQCFEWMKRAGVPHHIGRQVMAMPIGTRREFFGGWFQGMREKPPDENIQGGVPGESSRSPKLSGNTGERSDATSN